MILTHERYPACNALLIVLSQSNALDAGLHPYA